MTGNVLRITEASMADRGIYVCRAENAAGVDQDWSIVEVESKLLTVEINSLNKSSLSASTYRTDNCKISLRFRLRQSFLQASLECRYV